MKFNEDSRVKIPALIHLTRLGYQYLSLKEQKWDKETNVFTDIFRESIERINPDNDDLDIDKIYQEIKLLLENEDLGKAFYERIIKRSGIKLIDFEDFENNTFNVVTELTYKNEDEEFRPDIVLLINGMPLVFLEVKKPNNREGVIAEHNRIEKRFKNRKFRQFVNITQLMVFSNNMEYDNEAVRPLQGAFYSSTAYGRPVFNYFREEKPKDFSGILEHENDQLEDYILKDNNLTIIKHNPEFLTNKSHDTPTNRLSTSLFSKKRLAFFLEYSIAYVKDIRGYQKHVMRYPQFFATKA